MNVRGLRSKVGDVRDTITKEKLDILCITETMLSPAVADGELGIEGYFFVRQDRNSHGGRVAVYFRDSFPISRVQLRFNPENSDIVQNDTPETLFIELPGSQKRTILGCVYRPPSAPVASWSRLSDLVDSVISTHASEKNGTAVGFDRRFQRGRLGWRASPFPSLPVLSGLLWPLELCSSTNPVSSNKTKLSWPTVDRRSFACALVYTCSLDYGNWSWTCYCWSPHCPTALSTSCTTTLSKHQKHQCLFIL